MNHHHPLSSAAAREVIDTSQWYSIATPGPDGPHLAACWMIHLCPALQTVPPVDFPCGASRRAAVH